MSETQTTNSSDIEQTNVHVSTGGGNVTEEIEKDLLAETHEASSENMFLLLQEIHTDMRSFKSRLDRVEKGQSTEVDNEVVHNMELAPKQGGRKRRASTTLSDLHQDDVSDDESVLMTKVLSHPADPAEKSAENTSVDTDSLLSDIAQELSEQEPTGPAVNEDLAAMLNKRWTTKMSDKKLNDKLELIQRPQNCSGLIVPRVNPEIWSNLHKFKVCSFSATRYNITHVLLVTLVCKNKYRAPSRCIHDPTFRHSSLVSSSGVI